jgi:hypothetical protein
MTGMLIMLAIGIPVGMFIKYQSMKRRGQWPPKR